MARGTWNKVNNWFKDRFSDIGNWWNDLTGINSEKHANKADELAEQSQAFNEQYSKDQLALMEKQYEKANDLAQQNIDWQKDIAEKNLAAQQDAFNAQLAENQLTREREDTAYQRQVADLKAAGFSPLMASNGAGAASMSVGTAPQYDVSGVSTAQGSALDLAREYAQLRNMAVGQYLTRKQAAINERIGAKLALKDLSMQRGQFAKQQALNVANLALNVSKHRLEIGEYNWNKAHGFRNQNTWSVLLPVLQTLANNLGIDYDKLGNALKNIPGAVTNMYNNLGALYDGTESGFNKLKDTVEVLQGSKIKKNDYDSMLEQLYEPKDVSSEQVTDWYNDMSEKFRNKFSYGYFYDAITGRSQWRKSTILKYLMFGNSGNL